MSVMKSIHILIGASHATPDISETTLTNGHQAIKRLIILFKILKFMRTITYIFVLEWYTWDTFSDIIEIGRGAF